LSAIVAALIVVCETVGATEPAATIENAAIRATLTVLLSKGQWRLRVDARVDGRWCDTATLAIAGTFSSEELNRIHRKRLGTYYPLQKAMPKSIRRTASASEQQLSFRLVRADLWLDVQLNLRKDMPFLWIHSPAASRPELLPETTLRFAEPVFFMLADSRGTPMKRRKWQARDHRNRSLTVACEQYMAPWSREMDIVPMILWPRDSERRRAYWARGGLGTVYLQTPYVLAVDSESYERTAHSVQHRAVGFRSLLPELQRIGAGKGISPSKENAP